MSSRENNGLDSKDKTKIVTELVLGVLSGIGSGLASFASNHPEWFLSDFIKGMDEGFKIFGKKN